MPRSFLIVFNTILLFAATEGAARLAEWVHPVRDAVTFSYSPYRMTKMAQAPWPLNREGFRAAELETYHDSFLIEFLGGSVCAGVGDHPGDTIPERVEHALQAAGLVRARVLNLCQGGATSAQELAILIEYGLPLHPQAVFSFNGVNDVFHPRPVGEDDAANLPYGNAQLEARVNGRDGWSHLAAERVLRRLSRRFHPGRFSAEDPVPIGAIVDSYLYHLSVARTLAESRGALYAVLLQPTLHLEKPWSAEETAMWRDREADAGEAMTRTAQERYRRARAALEQWAGSGNAALYDLTRVFAATTETVYSDSAHFRGARGYEMLFAELERRGFLDRLRERYRIWEAGL